MTPYKMNLTHSAITAVMITVMYVYFTDAVLLKAVIRTVAFMGFGIGIVISMMFVHLFVHQKYTIRLIKVLLALMYISIGITFAGFIALVLKVDGLAATVAWNTAIIATAIRTGFLIPFAMFCK